MTPAEVGAADAKPVLELGVSKQALSDAIHVVFLFSIYTRLADTMGWNVPAGEAPFAASAKSLLTRGYRLS